MCGARAFFSKGSGGSVKAMMGLLFRGRMESPVPPPSVNAAARPLLRLERALDQQFLDEVLRVAVELAEDHAHAGRVLLDTDDLANPLDGLDVIHDDREAQVDPRADGKGLLRLDEHSGARDVRHVLLDERVEGL